MQKVFDDVNALDKRCIDQFGLSEDLLMEHAAASMMQYIQGKFSNNEKVLIVCGSGNNGADGIALARLLYSQYDVNILMPYHVKSAMAKLQYKRAKLLGIKIIDSLSELSLEHGPDVIVDCLFGSGLNRDLDDESQRLITRLNSRPGHKIACDIPSGINKQGKVTTVGFCANITITMGALKTQLYSDVAKDYTGGIIVSDLGVHRSIYETTTNTYLLDPFDMQLPLRTKQNSHKGSFGHLSVIVGNKTGAGIIAAEAAFAFGAGLVTVVTDENVNIPFHIMQQHTLPEKCTAIAVGMGLGQFIKAEMKQILDIDIPKVVDADLFHDEIILTVLNHENVVLTPHPKEFCSLLKLTKLAEITVAELQNNRFKYVRLFAVNYPKTVLLLKGANSLITYNNIIYINPLGSNTLSKGGSGDVLTGLISALLAQGYSVINATITASLAHAMSAKNYTKNNYALTPMDIIEGVKGL
ncbi:NAD(P)HX epimerase / NAD(P)HX dehydratase [Moritella sp. JT01]|uniref:bifunctional ADP-dependent NAD(P)H-hydrate dehydratase/NAD(P)H-hydrate epimerase n=1 Tax=Moritella sp. JT01 TaxID=756698 RepID=UPI00079AF27F|nr:bifunctional ADP-dependent NAD(P)H-hydrate dehydratase/NAD(P)H-hydrate epimerase [Moritella sp. JT01]KXO09128.1 NAD(P)HX epimerase / NAD(P)HX dehydratase [Moritella sp. JT01]